MNTYDFLSQYSVTTGFAKNSLHAVECGRQFRIQVEVLFLKKDDITTEEDISIFLKSDVTGKTEWLPFIYREDNLWEVTLKPQDPGLFRPSICFFEGGKDHIRFSSPSFTITSWLRVDQDGIDVIKTVFVREYGKYDSESGTVCSGTFHDLLPYLKDFKEKGIDALILLPIHSLGKGLWGPVGCPYEPMDFFSIEPSLVKANWGAGTGLLQTEWKNFLNGSSTEELEAFSNFKKEKRIDEYAHYNAARMVADRKNISVKNMRECQDDPDFLSLVEQTCYEQFVAKKSFRHLVKTAHATGLKIFMDIPGYFGTHSIAESFFEHLILKNSDGSYYQPGTKQWGNGWYTLRQLDIKKPGVLDYLCSIYRYWRDVYKVDGFRIDAVLSQPHQYIRCIRKELSSSFLIGETIGEYKGDREKKYFDDIKLNSIYSSDWIWTDDIKGYLQDAHKRPLERRMLHMRDTHDEGRLKKGDCFAHPKERYLGLLAAGILGFPGKDIIGLLDGNFDLIKGIPDLHDIALKDTSDKNSVKITFSNDAVVHSKDYIQTILKLRKTISVFRKNGNITFLEQKQRDICSYLRTGEEYDVMVLANLGDKAHRAVISLPLKGYTPGKLIDLLTGAEFADSGNNQPVVHLNIGQSCVFVLRKTKNGKTINQQFCRPVSTEHGVACR